MGEREQHHADTRARRPRARGGWFVVAMLALLVGSTARLTYLDRLPDPNRQPDLVLPPPGLDLPEPTTPRPVAAAVRTGAADPAAVSAAIATHLRGLGRHSRVLVTDLASDRVLFDAGTGSVTPASTTKLLTSVAALETLGAEHRFTTSVVRQGHRLILRGGGDPMLTKAKQKQRAGEDTQASLARLADLTAARLGPGGRFRLAYDDSLFTGPAINPNWPPGYVPDGVVPPITALWDDTGHRDGGVGYGFVADPSLDAAADFAQLLRDRGVRVVGAPVRRVAPETATPVAEVQGASLATIVSHLLEVSDNNVAEVVGHQVGLAVLQDGSFAGGAKAVLQVLQNLGVNPSGARLYDGSGLSRDNALDPALLAAVVRLAASSEHPGLRTAVTGMPVAGLTGSLQNRFDRGDPHGLGRVQAKTGTLTGVHGLAGVVTDVDGNAYAFVAIADRVAKRKELLVRTRIDQLAAALAGCRCSGTESAGTP